MKNFIKDISHIWSNTTPNLVQAYDGDLLLQTSIFDQFAEINGSMVSIHNIQKLSIAYISPNVLKMLGISQQNAFEYGNAHFMSRLRHEHQHYLATLFGLIQAVMHPEENIDLLTMRACVCGVQYAVENGEFIRLLLDYSMLPPMPNTEKPTHCLGLLYNVSHLYKREDFWIRFTYQTPDGKTRVKAFHPDFDPTMTSDFISPREQEILDYICQGYETTDIVKKLHISPNTVNNHRQKLLDKLGVKDKTALVQLAQKIFLPAF